MIHLLDTNVLSDLMRKHPRVTARFAGLPPGDSAVICPIVQGEIRYGVERLPPGARRRGLEVAMSRLLLEIPCEPLPPGAGDFYARTRLACEQKGLATDENDLWIVAAALAASAVVVSRDVDLHRIPGLMVEDWSK